MQRKCLNNKPTLTHKNMHKDIQLTATEWLRLLNLEESEIRRRTLRRSNCGKGAINVIGLDQGHDLAPKRVLIATRNWENCDSFRKSKLSNVMNNEISKFGGKYEIKLTLIRNSDGFFEFGSFDVPIKRSEKIFEWRRRRLRRGGLLLVSGSRRHGFSRWPNRRGKGVRMWREVSAEFWFRLHSTTLCTWGSQWVGYGPIKLTLSWWGRES